MVTGGSSARNHFTSWQVPNSHVTLRCGTTADGLSQCHHLQPAALVLVKPNLFERGSGGRWGSSSPLALLREEAAPAAPRGATDCSASVATTMPSRRRVSEAFRRRRLY